MRSLRVLFLIVFAISLPLSAIAAPLVHFEDETTGASVVGLGTIHPMLDIQSSPGEAKIIEGLVPGVYGAPNTFAPYYPPNNCLENADGIRVNADSDGNQALDEGVMAAKGFGQPPGTATNQSYTISFAKSVSSFSIRVFDFGDFNPTNATNHSISLKAYDGITEVAADGIAYTSDGKTNPRTSSYGDLLYGAGDACDADFGEPGYLELSVNNPLGFTNVELTMTGQDPKIGFDSIDFTPCTRTIGYWKNHEWPTTVYVGSEQLITEADGSVKDAELKEDKGILWNATGKNFSMLCAQLIAAKLNCYGGDCVPGGVIDAADDLLISERVYCTDPSTWDFSSKAIKRQAAPIVSELDAFNNTYECMEVPPLLY